MKKCLVGVMLTAVMSSPVFAFVPTQEFCKDLSGAVLMVPKARDSGVPLSQARAPVRARFDGPVGSPLAAEAPSIYSDGPSDDPNVPELFSLITFRKCMKDVN
jgi:hypothetical protein